MWHSVTVCVHDDWPYYATATLREREVVVTLSVRDGSGPTLVERFPSCDYPPGELRSHWREYVAKFVAKRVPPAGGELSAPEAVDSAFEGDYPGLHEHLTLDWLSGKRRVTSTLTVFCDAGRWKGSLRDRDNGLVCFCSADTFLGVLGALERAVVSGDGDWREEQRGGGGPPRRK